MDVDDNNNKIHPVKFHFVYNEKENTNLCKYCFETKKGNHSGNLLRHIEARHRAVYDSLLPSVNTFNSKFKTVRRNETKILNVKFNLDELKEGLIALCTVDGRPFSIVDDLGMKIIMKPIYSACDKQEIDFRINRQKIKVLCEEKRAQIVQIIKNETKNKIVNAQMDIATVQNRLVHFSP